MLVPLETAFRNLSAANVSSWIRMALRLSTYTMAEKTRLTWMVPLTNSNSTTDRMMYYMLPAAGFSSLHPIEASGRSSRP